MLRKLLVLALLLLAARAVCAADPQEILCPRADTPPTLDGRLDDAC